MNYADLASSLTESLSLAVPPVAVTARDGIPDGVPAFDGVVPGGCRFWQEAASRTFATVTADHELCSIGVHTHGLTGASPATADELATTLSVMADLDYVRADDVAQIPVLARGADCVVYGPLADTAMVPDVVLLITRADQSLILAEAAQQADGAVAPALGRPACALVPQVAGSGRAAVSLGCCGARAYLDVLTDDVALWGLPGARIDEYVARVVALAGANRTLTAFHERRRADIESGQRPTVKQSLDRLS